MFLTTGKISHCKEKLWLTPVHRYGFPYILMLFVDVAIRSATGKHIIVVCVTNCRNTEPRCMSWKVERKQEMIASEGWRVRRKLWSRRVIWCRCEFVYHIIEGSKKEGGGHPQHPQHPVIQFNWMVFSALTGRKISRNRVTVTVIQF